MNANRRKFFGLSVLPLATLPVPTLAVSGTAILASTQRAKDIPMRGEVCDFIRFPSGERVPRKWTMLMLSNPDEIGGQVLASSRMVEVEIGGKREYVMTFTREK